MDWVDRVPKVELHLHLEGAIPVLALWQLVDKYGGDPETPTPSALAQRFEYRDFPHFIDTWVWKNRFLRELEDFTFIAEAVARDLARQNICYVEAFFSPADFAKAGLEPQALTSAIRDGLDRVDAIEVKLVCDLVRDFGPARAERMLDAIAEVRDRGVIGIGIGGSEHAFPPEPFAPVYQRARDLGLRTSAHAGEAAGPPSIWGAIRELRVDRVGHGTRAHEDPALVEHLVATRTPLEMCPMSNVRTQVVPELAAHPIRDYRDRGVLVTVNTDDPAMFHTSLADEYRGLQSTFGFTDDDVRALIDDAVTASWLPEDGKRALRARLAADPSWA